MPDSWVTIPEADLYFSTKFGCAAWNGFSETEKSSLLITAFNWINQQADFIISPTETSIKVKQAQMEAAWFIYKWWDGYEERRALQSGGVKSFSVSKFSESYEQIQFPAFIGNMLLGFISSVGGSGFALMTRDLE